MAGGWWERLEGLAGVLEPLLTTKHRCLLPVPCVLPAACRVPALGEPGGGLVL